MNKMETAVYFIFTVEIAILLRIVIWIVFKDLSAEIQLLIFTPIFMGLSIINLGTMFMLKKHIDNYSDKCN